MLLTYIRSIFSISKGEVNVTRVKKKKKKKVKFNKMKVNLLAADTDMFM